jgi:hypothetical protein
MLLMLDLSLGGDIDGFFGGETSSITKFVHELALLPDKTFVRR